MVDAITLSAMIFMTALGGWDMFWQHLADEARTGPSDRHTIENSDGFIMSRGGVVVDHMPYKNSMRFHDVRVRGAMDGQKWTWQFGEVVVETDPLRPDLVNVIFPSPQKLDMTGPLGNGRLTLWATNLAAKLDLAADGRVTAARLAGDGLTLTGFGLDSRADSLTIAMGEDDQQRRLLEVAMQMVELPAPARFAEPIGRVMQQGRLSAWVSGVHPERPRTLADWQARSGSIGVPKLAVDWGSLSINGTARTALDEELRPQGRVAMDVQGVNSAVEAAHAAGMIDSGTRENILNGLEQVAALRGDEGDVGLSAELAMAGGRLSWAGLPIMALPSFARPAISAR